MILAGVLPLKGEQKTQGLSLSIQTLDTNGMSPSLTCETEGAG